MEYVLVLLLQTWISNPLTQSGQGVAAVVIGAFNTYEECKKAAVEANKPGMKPGETGGRVIVNENQGTGVEYNCVARPRRP